MPDPPILLTASTDMATETTSELFRGSDHDVEVSCFINHTRPGAGTAALRSTSSSTPATPPCPCSTRRGCTPRRPSS